MFCDMDYVFWFSSENFVGTWSLQSGGFCLAHHTCYVLKWVWREDKATEKLKNNVDLVNGPKTNEITFCKSLTVHMKQKRMF